MSWMLGPFKRVEEAIPCLVPDLDAVWTCPINGPLAWEAKDVFNPAAVVRDGKVCLLYRAEDNVGSMLGTSRIGLAESNDGLAFTKRPTPVLYPDNDGLRDNEWDGGCEDPRIVEKEEGGYLMTYSAWNGSHCRLSVATSDDLVTWKKHGTAFGDAYDHLWSKSGSIICRCIEGRMIATRVNGLYWMYWGETSIFLACSEDLINWHIITSTHDEKKVSEFEDGSYHVHFEGGIIGPRPVIRPGRGRFDSALVEPGPPAILTDKGILLLYNSANSDDPTRPPMSYAPGQILFDARDPATVIARCTEPFMTPNQPGEEIGQVNNVVFIEGLVYHEGQWLLYFGMADSLIGVAVCPDNGFLKSCEAWQGAGSVKTAEVVSV
jgi:predicted GH43/DUF377 family glycosyl hydrolase